MARWQERELGQTEDPLPDLWKSRPLGTRELVQLGAAEIAEELRKGKGAGTSKKRNDQPNTDPAQKCWTCGKLGYMSADCGDASAVSYAGDDDVMGSLSLTSLNGDYTYRGKDSKRMLAAHIDSRVVRSFIPIGLLQEYPVRQDEESLRQDRSATGQAVAGKGFQSIFSVDGGSVRALKMCGGRVQKPPMSVYDMCKGHRVVRELNSHGEDGDSTLNLKTSERTLFRLRNHMRELDMRSIPTRDTADIVREAQEKQIEELCPLGGHARSL